jgi:large repetitive protein
MGCSRSGILRLRLGVVGMLLALSLVACGQVSTSSGPPLKSNSSDVPPSSGGGTSTADSLAISGTPPASVVAGQRYSFTPAAAAPSGSSLSFTIVNLPGWASFDSSTGQLAGTPTSSSIGTYANIEISISDGQATATLPAFSIDVLGALTISGSPTTQVVAGSHYSFAPTTNVASGTTLTFSVQNQPAWATFNATTGELSGIAQTGTFPDIVISVSDGIQSSALAAFSITVSAHGNGGSPPSISGHPATGVLAGSLYVFTPTASDPGGHALTFSIQNQPSWASFSGATGTLTGTPTATNAGTYGNIVIGVSNGTQSAALAPFAIKVSAPLKISGSPPTQVTAGKGYSFQPTTNAPNGGALQFSIQNRPAWASFIAGTGMLSGTPTASQTGTYSGVVISVSDGVQTVALPPFSITVQKALAISGSPPTSVTVGWPYSFTPSASGASGSTLRFSIQSQPSWASFNAASGALTGAPSAANAGTYANIVISVSDGTQSVALSPFSIQVVKGVTISGSPPTSVNAGAAFSFTPAASGPSGAALTFSIQNQPPWASFNAANGALTGTPGAAYVGTYSNIMISVASGGASASLPAFAISVNQVSNGTASLSWTPVTENTNGTVLGNLAGYRVHYGTSANAMNTVVTLSNPSLTNYLVTDLSSGTWYFGITAYTANGVEGSLSNVGRKTIP